MNYPKIVQSLLTHEDIKYTITTDLSTTGSRIWTLEFNMTSPVVLSLQVQGRNYCRTEAVFNNTVYEKAYDLLLQGGHIPGRVVRKHQRYLRYVISHVPCYKEISELVT